MSNVIGIVILSITFIQSIVITIFIFLFIKMKVVIKDLKKKLKLRDYRGGRIL